MTDSENQQKELLRFVVIGAGPTGIETATEIYDLIKFILLKRYPEIDPDIPEVHLVQSGERILPGWHESIVNTATKQLQQMKIKLMLGQRVTKITDKAVFLKSGEAIPTVSAIWCAGVKSHPLIAASRLPQDKSGRALVQEDLRVPGLDNVFVLGDASYSLDFKTQQPLPPLGQVAFQQGSHTGRNLVRLLRNEQTKPFKYFNFGALVSVGEHFAAVDLLGVRLSGFIGWIIWRSLYLAKIVGVSNKIRIVLDWTLDLLIERSITQIGDGRKAWPMANVKAISPGVQASSLPEDRSAKNDLRAGWKPPLPEAFAD